jgi:PAS domain S-box-containing protein
VKPLLERAVELAGRLVAASSDDGMLAFDRELRISYWSPLLERWSGVASHDVVGRPVTDVLPFLASDGGDHILRVALAGGTARVRDRPYLLETAGRRGRVDIHTAPLDGEDHSIGGVALIRDTTARHAAEQTVSEVEQRFQNMANAAPVLLWMSRSDSLCTFFNQTWLDFTGRTLEQEWGVGWAEGVHFEDLQRCLDSYVDAFNARRTFEIEYRLRRADGAYRWILDRGTPRYTADGTFAGFIGSCVDITALREAIGIKDEFLGMVSHELRTPLTTVSLVLERLRTEYDAPLTDRQHAMLGRMDRALQRLVQLVESLLQFSRIERGGLRVDRRELDLRAELELTIDELRPAAAHKGLSLGLAAPATVPPIVSDPDLIRLIVSNLVANAIKFTDHGAVSVALSFEAECHRIEVRDTGTGIPAKAREKVFEPFERLERSGERPVVGIGLGLAVVKALTTALGGHIELRSEVGSGSTFAVHLPKAGRS